MKNLKIYILLVLFLYVSNCFSQKVDYKGMPFIRNFSAKEYNGQGQNWAVAQDIRGVMYFGNGSGILEFDGENWRKYKITNHSNVRSLAIDSNGTLFVGAFNEFGYMTSDSSGRLSYVSLMNKLEEKDRKFNDVWKICITTEGVFFLTINKIYKYHNNEFKVINIKLLSSLGFVANNQLFLIQEDKGLFVFKNDTVVKLPQTSNIYVDFIIPFYDNKILIYNSKGFYVYNLALVSRNENSKKYYDKDFPSSIIKKINLQVENYIRENGLYSFSKIDDNSFAAGTMRGGMIIFDKKGDFVQLVNKNFGLQNNTVLFIYVDKSKNIWVALNSGISYLQINSPITRYTSLNKIEGGVLNLTRHNNTTYYCTAHGVFYIPEFNLKNANKKYSVLKVKNADFTFWDFIKINGCLLAGGSYGIVQIKDSIAIEVAATNSIYSFGKSKRLSNYLFLGLTSGFMSLEIDTNNKSGNVKFIKRHNFDEFNEPIRLITSDSLGNLWLTSEYNGIYKVDFLSDNDEKYKITHYDTADGLPQLDNNFAYNINNKMLISTSKGVFKPIPSNKGKNIKFVRDTSFQEFFNSKRVNKIDIDKGNKLWASTDFNIGSFQKGEKSKLIYNDTVFRKLTNLYSFCIDSSGVIWIYNENEKIYRYDDNIKQDYHISHRALIREVKISLDSSIFYGTYFNDTIKKSKYYTRLSYTQPNTLIPIINHKNNSVSFSFSSTFFENSKTNKYKYKLIGFDKKWSNWVEQTKKEYTNLPNGDYNFVVKSKNYYGIESSQASFKFTVLPPWFKTILAYVFYAIIFILLIFLILRINSKRLLAANLKLEEIVRQRTSEIRQQKEELQANSKLIKSVNKELKRKSVLITDSLSYAKRIQDSTLPSNVMIKKYLPQSFVFFHPRDIVSGDFYWFATYNNKEIIAVVDSTGHGVPGAFMSMIGNTLLNEIVINEKVYKPSLILEKLNSGIIKVLNQEIETDDVQNDGMNISICCIDKINKQIEIANADQMAYLIRDNNVITIDADIFSVGGNFSRKFDVRFTNRIFDYKEGDMLYLFSDGYQDQFGGKNNTKFMASNFKQLLLSLSKIEIQKQFETLNDTFFKWKGNTRQIDDVLVIGIRLDF
ncbi:MAG: SpoIIE family protein phosphatase [Bacteroidetes bacterium]|nr:SpoIIE family protein phosphatase [Bacteroidota bacterium]